MIKSHLKNFTPLREMKLVDMICYYINQQDTKKIKVSNFENTKNPNNSLIKKYLSERSDLIQYLNRLVKQFKYTDRTFYNTISIFDTIFAIIDSQNIKLQSDFKIDLFIVSSLLLSGIYFVIISE